MSKIKILNETEWLAQLRTAIHSSYYAMYSSLLKGVVLDPVQMLIPLDDHMVHRGDGVFEAIKVLQGKPYLLEAHLQRLLVSSEKIGLKSPLSLHEWKELISQFLQVVPHGTHLLRLFLSRGSGSFSQNPYDCPHPQYFLVATKLSPPPVALYETGAKIGVSQYPSKPGWMAQIKSCNYLPNVLMKKEAVDRKLDFVVGLDSQGFLTEGSTENFAIIDEQGVLRHPPRMEMLMGTTLHRLFELAELKGALPIQRDTPISIDHFLKCKEAFMIGTTLDVLPISVCVTPEGQYRIPMGPWASQMLQWIQNDQQNNI